MKSAKSVKTLALGFSHFHPNGNSLLAEMIILFLKMTISAWVDVKNEMSLLSCLSMFMLMRLFIHSKKKKQCPAKKKNYPTCTNHVNSARSPQVFNRKSGVLCWLCLVGL